jgi:hypothetical protein
VDRFLPHIRTIEPARALAAETLKLERALSDLVNQAYGLTPRHPTPVCAYSRRTR